MTDKKDVLEFPLEKVTVPAAIKLMMQAATKCVGFNHEITVADFEAGKVTIPVDNDRLQELADKLEARVQDEIDSAMAVRTEPAPEDDPNGPSYVPVDEDDEVTKVMFEGEVEFVVINGIVFKKMCNEPVAEVLDADGGRTYCIKQWGHKSPDHEDQEGNVR